VVFVLVMYYGGFTMPLRYTVYSRAIT